MVEKSNCRYCNSELKEVFDLGYTYPSAYIKKDEENLYNRSSLILSQCTSCNLIQLQNNYNLNFLFKDYYYKSNANSDMIKSLQDIVNEIEKRIELKNNDVILDIGANDGTLLSLYKNKNLFKIGIDPENSFYFEAIEKMDILVNDFFDLYKYPIKKKAKVITAIAMWYDLIELNNPVKEIKRILANDGIFVIQFTDWYNSHILSEISNICQEHCNYYTIQWLFNYFKENNLEVFDISMNETNGGSTRFYISHPEAFKVEENVQKYLQKEQEYFNSFIDPFESFKEKVEFNKNTLVSFLKKCKEDNKIVMSLGSSTKFNFLAQYYNLNSDLIKCIGEISEAKIGKVTLGTGIPIVHEKEILESNPDYIMVNIWQFRPFFERLLKDYVDKGGSVIFPLPEPEIWNKSGVHKIRY